jgi:crotonobetainyl-CoA:carnitine CoA-transferase CaiB-like acyl-CoA transferase
MGLPYANDMGMYYIQQNAGKRNLSLDLNYPEAREIVKSIAAEVDIIVENFRPGTLKRFGFSYDDIRQYNPRIIYASLSGYGQNTSWKNRPAFAPTVHGETGHTRIVAEHFGDALTEPRNDACSHADVYTGLQGVIGILAAVQHRHVTGEGQHIDVAMAATMLSVNERAGALLSGIDTAGEPIALSANESHVFTLSDGRQITIAASPIHTPFFTRYCAMMRRNDLVRDPRFATAHLRRENIGILLKEVLAWIKTFSDLDQLQAQVSEAGLALGSINDITEFAKSDWIKEWGAIVEVDDRSGGTTRMPGQPWKFSNAPLPEAGIPYFQGENNDEILEELGVAPEAIRDLSQRRILVSRRSPLGAPD